MPTATKADPLRTRSSGPGVPHIVLPELPAPLRPRVRLPTDEAIYGAVRQDDGASIARKRTGPAP